MGRWIRIDTAVFEHAAFAIEPYSEREAWLWMIAKAAWKDTKHRVGSNLMPVPMGSFYSTVREMQAAWRWKSTTRVVTYLRRLEKEDMISQETSTGKTQITLCNYSKFQSVEDKEKTEKIQAEDSEKTQKTPVNQDTISSSLRSEQRKRGRETGKSPEEELAIALDPEHVSAVIEYRQRRKPALTAYAAKLLAAKFARCPNPNYAADAMISNGWQGFEPEWLERRSAGHTSQAPPRKSGHQAHQDEARSTINNFLGIKGYDDTSGDSAIIELEQGNWRPH